VVDVAVQPDGKILAVGATRGRPGHTFPGAYFALMRYLPDGSLDPAFGTATARTGGWTGGSGPGVG